MLAGKKGNSTFVIRGLAAVLCVLSAVFAAMNLADEGLLKTIQDGAFYFTMWMLTPLVSFCWCVRSTTLRQAFLPLLFLGFTTWVFGAYAMNGPTAEREGAQHMHIVIVPFLLLILLLFEVVIYRILFKQRPQGTESKE